VRRTISSPVTSSHLQAAIQELLQAEALDAVANVRGLEERLGAQMLDELVRCSEKAVKMSTLRPSRADANAI
jgi:hypothetical protein